MIKYNLSDQIGFTSSNNIKLHKIQFCRSNIIHLINQDLIDQIVNLLDQVTTVDLIKCFRQLSLYIINDDEN